MSNEVASQDRESPAAPYKRVPCRANRNLQPETRNAFRLVRAAEILGIGKTTLYRKLQSYRQEEQSQNNLR